MRKFFFVVLSVSWLSSVAVGDGIVIDHNDTDITALSQNAMQLAKDTLHIGYGHTSHGSQVTSGMTGLVAFVNGGGLGLSLPNDFFEWNNGGSGDALDLEEGDGYGSGWLDHDCGYAGWDDETRDYLDDPSHSDVNVIIWSWCGQVAGKTEASMISDYLTPMNQLETEYPNVHFVYMTGHREYSSSDVNNKARNQQIRDYCIDNDKILYDFADIESYDPDGTYFEFADDDCDYFAGPYSSTKLGNWAYEWQNDPSHVEDVDWYNCSCAHSVALNGNQKAYGAWALWTEIAASMLTSADFDDDGDIDGADFLTWQRNHGTETDATHEQGDANGDGAVNGEDFAIWQQNFGSTGGAGAPVTLASVPEPTAWILGMLAALWCGGKFRHGSQKEVRYRCA